MGTGTVAAAYIRRSAVSADSPGDASREAQQASVTVYDSSTGAVTYSCGQLGYGMLTFAGQLLE